MVNVATESVVLSYDRSGVGVNKIREQGALDVKGNIYADNKPIQQYQLTDNNGCGKLIKQDFNSMKDTGFWWIDGTSPNNPFGAWGMLEVFRPNPNSQECIQRFTTSFGYMAVRENGFDNNWRPWRYLVQQSKSTNNSDYVALSKTESNPTPWQNANLQNGWSHHRDYGNVQFSKTFDGIVYLKGTCKGGNTTRESIIFTLPENFRPSTTLFKTALNNDYGSAVIGIYPSGNVVVKGNVDATWLNFDNVSFKI